MLKLQDLHHSRHKLRSLLLPWTLFKMFNLKDFFSSVLETQANLQYLFSLKFKMSAKYCISFLGVESVKIQQSLFNFIDNIFNMPESTAFQKLHCIHSILFYFSHHMFHLCITRSPIVLTTSGSPGLVSLLFNQYGGSGWWPWNWRCWMIL